MNELMLVTGAGRGIGAATAELAATRGWTVAVNYLRDQAAAEAVCARIVAAGGAAFPVQADVSDETQVLALFATLDARGLPLTALVNIAPFCDYTSARLERTFAINVLGAFLVAREALKRMSTARGGAGGGIVNLSSAAARIGSPNEFIDYAASKGAIDAMTLGLAKEFATQGVRVNAVRPGLIDTEIHASAGAPDRIERFTPMIPMRRAGTAMEVAEAILWLLSREAAYVTGTFIDVSGGR